MSQTEPGWYHADGDPPGTMRYWDGAQWVGEPTTQQPTYAGGDGRNYGTAGVRLGARIIDGIIVAIPIFIGLFAVVDDATDQGEIFTWILLSVIWGAVYEIGFIGSRGATPGKSILGLKVIDLESGDSPPSWQQAAFRWAPAVLGLIPVLSNFIGLVLAIASGVMISNDDQNRSVYDRIAKTGVVKT